MKNFISVILISSVLFTACSGETVEVEKTIELQNTTLTAEDTLAALGLRAQGAGHTGDFAYRTDSLNEYSAAIEAKLNDSLVGSKIRVCLNFWVKSTNPLKGDCIGLSLCKKDGNCTWSSFDVVNYTNKPNEWTNIVDSFTYNANQFNEPSSLIKVFAFHPNKNTIVDFDDINIKIKKVYTVVE